jgi:Transposase DDE domain
MDGSGVGRGCCALMLHVIYQGRALPLAWRGRQCPKGHCPADLHIALVELVLERIPEGTKVVFLGDGEFDGIKRQETMHEAGWWYACRTSKGNTAPWDDETCHGDELGACIKPGRLIELKEVALTRAAYGPVRLRCCWAQGHAEPLSLVRNMSSAEEAIDYYKKRFRIEAFFSDQKRRGFNIYKSHLTDPQRLSRL